MVLAMILFMGGIPLRGDFLSWRRVPGYPIPRWKRPPAPDPPNRPSEPGIGP
jgi:hypothetical protein